MGFSRICKLLYVVKCVCDVFYASSFLATKSFNWFCIGRHRFSCNEKFPHRKSRLLLLKPSRNASLIEIFLQKTRSAQYFSFFLPWLVLKALRVLSYAAEIKK